MIYSYKCDACDKIIEITKPVSGYASSEVCSTCGSTLVRHFQGSRIHLYGTAVQHPYFSHAFGQVVRGSSHEKAIAREKNCIEVGNEDPAKHCKIERLEYDI